MSAEAHIIQRTDVKDKKLLAFLDNYSDLNLHLFPDIGEILQHNLITIVTDLKRDNLSIDLQ